MTTDTINPEPGTDPGGTELGTGLALVVLSESSVEPARKLRQTRLPEALLYGLKPRVRLTDQELEFENVPNLLTTLFLNRVALVVYGSCGLVVRCLAPVLRDKHLEPPVLVVDRHASSTQPILLLGRHHGGEQLLARCVGQDAKDTKEDELLDNPAAAGAGASLEAPPPGWTCRTPEPQEAWRAMRTKLALGQRLWIETPYDLASLGLLDAGLASKEERPGERSEERTTEGPDLLITVFREPSPQQKKTPGQEEETRHETRNRPSSRQSSRASGVASRGASRARLVYTPPGLALGVGMARGAKVETVCAFILACLERAGLDPAAVAVLGSLTLKADEAGLHALAQRLRCPLRFFEPHELASLGVPNPSEAVRQAVGTPSVAEAAALLMAGAGSQLLMPKQKNAMCTVAVAASREPLVPSRIPGRALGHLAIVGLGPGAGAYRSPRATIALAESRHWVGYQFYLDQVPPAPHAQCHAFPLGTEVERVDYALDLAEKGEKVALVCSGDPNIYGLASLVAERLAGARSPMRRGIQWEVVPSITAMQLAAARLGGFLGHDFCAISLSDLLTPAAVIRSRVRHAAQADFVCALYNPQSDNRRILLPETLALFRRYRGPQTPLVWARSLGRPQEWVQTYRLGAFLAETIEQVDMMSLVLVGSRTSQYTELAGRTLGWTPRGYGAGSGSG